tara:strand:- start:957 stop:1307 length:351 start_codon:yes stop_codon:yes gene_type:complete
MDKGDVGLLRTFATVGFHTAICSSIGIAMFREDAHWLAVIALGLLMATVVSAAQALFIPKRSTSYFKANLAVLASLIIAGLVVFAVNSLFPAVPAAGMLIWLFAWSIFVLAMANLT